MNSNFQLICPECKCLLHDNAVCRICNKTYAWLKEGKLISFQPDCNSFYNERYQDQWKYRNLKLPLQDILLSIRERISLSTRRERFFKRHLGVKDNPLILDIACGYGRELFKEYGRVVGLDIVLEPLHATSQIYDLCVHADAFSIPFPDGYFDYIVSSDFLGHIPSAQKDSLYQEFKRVLKPEGKMLHVIETDANNWHFRFAHKYPDLFQKYFVEAIGGHFGLELPTKAIDRLEDNGFRVSQAEKIWGELWVVEGYSLVFDNEYRKKSKLIKVIVTLSKVLSANIVLQELANVLLNPVSAVLERLTPLDNGQGLMVVCKKK